MKEGEKMDWGESGSIRVPHSVVKQLDRYKKKHGYTSRPQAIISMIERAEKADLVEEIKKLLEEFEGISVKKNIQTKKGIINIEFNTHTRILTIRS